MPTLLFAASSVALRGCSMWVGSPWDTNAKCLEIAYDRLFFPGYDPDIDAASCEAGYRSLPHQYVVDAEPMIIFDSQNRQLVRAICSD